MTKDQAYQLIDAYVQNGLSQADKLQFEQWLSQDSDLQLEVELQQLTSEILVSNHLDTVQKEINSYHQLQLRKAKWMKYGIATICAGILFIGLYLWNTKSINTSSNKQIPSQAIVTTENNTTVDSIEVVPVNTTEKPVTKKNNKIITVQPDSTTTVSNNNSSNDEEKAKDLPVVTPVKTDPTITQNQQQTTTVVKNPCDGVQLTGKYQIVGTCPNKTDGQIIISKITGGTSPYQYELKHNNQLLSLSHLESGMYTLTIKDKNNCEVSYSNIKVPNLTCQENFVFNPFIGETWKTVVGNKSGQLTVYDISGSIYYQKSFTSNEEIEWNGNSVRGNTQSGQYIYIIKYSDGLSTTGNITLVD
ncbi:MAG: hypothetical protein U0U66_04325 [Cytophagaceae bacterium]